MKRQLYYITHIDNVPSILKQGILSHALIEQKKIEFTQIYDKQIVGNRHNIRTPDGRSLWDFANLYFQPRNPMLYRVVCEKSVDDIVILAIGFNILNREDTFITDGNAASLSSEILPKSEGKGHIPRIMKNVDKEYWTDKDGSKRKIMAEFLIPELVPPEYIQEIYVANHKVSDKLSHLGKEIIPEPRMFFQSHIRKVIHPNFSIVEGDMFFSRMHTLTVSVNCVGVMGKGLASRAKYQFPDVYVLYQDSCRNGGLRMGKPYLYKRETSFDYELADESLTLSNANTETWFLLFPTKQHWREDADIDGIEKGLEWLLNNYKKEGIKSIAMPTLGGGLGRLDWHQVGPLLCKYLSKLDITVQLYLPAEKKVTDDLLSEDFLLK